MMAQEIPTKPAWSAIAAGLASAAGAAGAGTSESTASRAKGGAAAAEPLQNGVASEAKPATAAAVAAKPPTAAAVVKGAVAAATGGASSASSASAGGAAAGAAGASAPAAKAGLDVGAVGTPGQHDKEKGSKASPESDGSGQRDSNDADKAGAKRDAANAAAGDESAQGKKDGESGGGASKKPAWNIVSEPAAEVPVPASDGTQVWPTLADTKEPLPKKEQRKLAEQQAAAAAAASKDQASTSGAESGQRNRSQGKREKKGGKSLQQGPDVELKGKNRSRRGKKDGAKSGDSDTEAPNGGQGAPQGGQGGQNQGGQGKQKKGGQGKARNMGGMHKMHPAMAYGMAAPMMYTPPAPVFYPPAAYGVASNGMETLMAAIRKQIDYYFSEENLVKDMFLRSKMEGSGWVEMATIAAFNRVRMLTPDLSIIAQSLEGSPVIEMSADGLFLRAKEGPEQWVLPKDQRDPALRSPVDPTVLTAQMQAQGNPEGKKKKRGKGTNGATSAGAKETSNSSQDDDDDVFQLDEEHDGQSSMSKSASSNKLAKLIVVKPSSTQKSALSAQLESSKGANAVNAVNASNASDIHADIHAGLEQYGQELRKPSGGPKASKAVDVSNPMVNGRLKHANFYPSSVGQSFMANRYHSKGGKAHGGAVGWVLGSTPDGSPRFMSPSNRRGSYLGSAPLQKFQHPSYELLEENGFTEIKYEKFHDRCIEERTEKGVGLSEEMNTLFRFWCYFLRDHFEEVMYEDFKKYALEDSEQGYHYGIECLFRFFSYGLETHFDAKLYKEFEEYVLLDHKGGHLYGLEKLWAYHHYHGLPKDCGFEMHPDLKKLLETDFKTIDDFKAKREANLHRSS